MERPKIGQHFRWQFIPGDVSGEAVVKALRSDYMEGLSPEAEQYAAMWLEALGLSGSRTGEHLAVMLATDGQTYLDGQPVQLTFFDA